MQKIIPVESGGGRVPAAVEGSQLVQRGVPAARPRPQRGVRRVAVLVERQTQRGDAGTTQVRARQRSNRRGAQSD